MGQCENSFGEHKKKSMVYLSARKIIDGTARPGKEGDNGMRGSQDQEISKKWASEKRIHTRK